MESLPTLSGDNLCLHPTGTRCSNIAHRPTIGTSLL